MGQDRKGAAEGRLRPVSRCGPQWRGRLPRPETRGTDTHASTTDPDARLFGKGPGKEVTLCFTGHALTENRNGRIVGAVVIRASSHAEGLAALHLIAPHADRSNAVTLGADKAFGARDFGAGLREINVSLHLAQNNSGRRLSWLRYTVPPRRDGGGRRPKVDQRAELCWRRQGLHGDDPQPALGHADADHGAHDRARQHGLQGQLCQRRSLGCLGVPPSADPSRRWLRGARDAHQRDRELLEPGEAAPAPVQRHPAPELPAVPQPVRVEVQRSGGDAPPASLSRRGSSAASGSGSDASACATPSPRSGGCARASR